MSEAASLTLIFSLVSLLEVSVGAMSTVWASLTPTINCSTVADAPGVAVVVDSREASRGST